MTCLLKSASHFYRRCHISRWYNHWDANCTIIQSLRKTLQVVKGAPWIRQGLRFQIVFSTVDTYTNFFFHGWLMVTLFFFLLVFNSILLFSDISFSLMVKKHQSPTRLLPRQPLWKMGGISQGHHPFLLS